MDVSCGFSCNIALKNVYLLQLCIAVVAEILYVEGGGSAVAKYMSLKEYVYSYITDEINKGTLRAGEKLNEQEICDLLQISRTPVREALIQLTSDGFLENVPRKGFIIREVSEREARETYMILGALDGMAASLACGKLTESDFKNMNFYIASMDFAIDSDNFAMYYAQQENFHDVYVQRCDNRELIELLAQLKKKFLRKSYQFVEEENLQEILKDTNNEHRKIVEFFQGNKSKELEKYLRDIHWSPDWAYMEVMDKK